MPHIVVEYSDNLAKTVEETGLLEQLHTKVVDCGLFAPEAVKARGAAYTAYVLPKGAESFAHITCSILSGRTQEQRLELSESLFSLAQRLLPDDTKTSVNIHEMDKATYKK